MPEWHTCTYLQCHVHFSQTKIIIKGGGVRVNKTKSQNHEQKIGNMWGGV